MRIGEILYEVFFLGAVVAIGLSTTWEDSLAERISSIVLVFAWFLMNGGSPLGWLVVIATQFIRADHWQVFVTGVTQRFGGLYEGGGIVLGLVGWLIFVSIYVVHGFMLLAFELSSRESLNWRKIQPNVDLISKQPAKLARVVVTNMGVSLLYVFAMTLHAVLSGGTRGVRFEGDEQWKLPNKQEQLACFLVGLAWNEVVFYYSHMWMHKPRWYKMFHKQHHEYTAPFALCAIYCGAFEMLVSNLFAFLGVASIYRFHMFFTYLWVANAIMGTQTHHSGYRWPWTSLLDAQPDVHDLHHELFTVNYGNIGLLDKLHGTFREPRAHREDKCKVS